MHDADTVDASGELSSRIRSALRDVPDFPTPGILFKDITPVLSDAALMRDVVTAMRVQAQALGVTHVVGIESRGFLFGMPLAMVLGVAFVPARKPGKLPFATVREAYALEYRHDTLEMHVDALSSRNAADGAGGKAKRAHVLIVDDVLATGGTAAAACRLVERAGGEVAGVSVLVELSFLGGRAAMPGRTVDALVVL